MSNENENTNALAVVITTDWAKELPAQIHWNYDELKASLEKTLEPLKNMVLESTDENVKFAKSKRAEINKLGKMLTEARVGTKKKVLAPYLDFEEKANALIEMCREASDGFDDFVKKAESVAKSKKWAEIAAYLTERIKWNFSDELITKVNPYFFDWAQKHDKWLNATFKIVDVMAEIDVEISRCHEAYDNVVEMYTAEYEGLYLDLARESIVKDFDTGRVTLEISKKHREHERILAEEKAKIELAAKRKAEAEAAAKAREAAEAEAKRMAEEREREEREREAERKASSERIEKASSEIGSNDELNRLREIANRNVNRFSNYEEMAQAWSNEYDGTPMAVWMFMQKKEGV